MEPCCEPTADAGRACPACGRTGRVVDPITVKAMLRPKALATLTVGEHRFCSSPDCPIVYFGSSDLFRTEDVAVPVFQKMPPGARTVCHCFAITEHDIAREIESTGESTVVERISALVKAGRCACEVKNPQGSCCLGNVGSVTRALAANLQATTAGSAERRDASE